jgi:Uncharacterised nucleotidyltransferase
MLQGKLHATLALLNSKGIRALAFKGPALAVAAYGDLCRREFYDLDIFLSPEDARRSREVMKENGCVPVKYVRGQPSPIAAGCARGDEMCFLDPDGVMVEVHKELAYPASTFPLEFDAAWERRQSVDVAGQSAPTLDSTDVLLHLCVHGCKHRWRRLNWVCDIAALLCVPTGVDFEEALQRAKLLKCRRRFLIGLLLARDLLGARLPSAIARRTPELRRAGSGASQIRRTILSPSEIRTLPSSWAEFAFHFSCCDDWSGRKQVLGRFWTRLMHADPERVMPPLSGPLEAGLRFFRLGRRSQ